MLVKVMIFGGREEGGCCFRYWIKSSMRDISFLIRNLGWYRVIGNWIGVYIGREKRIIDFDEYFSLRWVSVGFENDYVEVRLF